MLWVPVRHIMVRVGATERGLVVPAGSDQEFSFGN